MSRNDQAKQGIFWAALFALSIIPNLSFGADVYPGQSYIATDAPSYFLTIAPAMPAAGQETVVSLSSASGQVRVGAVRWTLTGAPATNARAVGPGGSQYAFTPSGLGSYIVQAEFQDAQGMYITSSMEIVIGGGASSRTVLPQGIPAPDQNAFPPVQPYQPAIPAGPGNLPRIAEMRVAVNPPQPRIGQPTAFTFDFGNPLPAGTEVRWNVSGGGANNMGYSGRSKEVCTFTPTGQGPYVVEATLVDAGGSMLGKVTLGFIAM